MGPGPCFSSPKLGQLLRNATSAAIKLLVLVGACALWPEGVWCSEASCHSSGCKSRQQRSPVAVVVISSNGEGDRSVESLEVKAPGGWAFQSDPYRGASNLTGCSKCVNQEAPKYVPRAKRIAGRPGVPSRSDLGEGHVGIEVLDLNDDRTPRGH